MEDKGFFVGLAPDASCTVLLVIPCVSSLSQANALKNVGVASSRRPYQGQRALYDGQFAGADACSRFVERLDDLSSLVSSLELRVLFFEFRFSGYWF